MRDGFDKNEVPFHPHVPIASKLSVLCMHFDKTEGIGWPLRSKRNLIETFLSLRNLISQFHLALPEIQSGLKDLRVIKTTQSAFEHFIRDEFATLPDTNDRIFSTIVYAKWHYGLTNGVDYDKAW